MKSELHVTATLSDTRLNELVTFLASKGGSSAPAPRKGLFHFDNPQSASAGRLGIRQFLMERGVSYCWQVKGREGYLPGAEVWLSEWSTPRTCAMDGDHILLMLGDILVDDEVSQDKVFDAQATEDSVKFIKETRGIQRPSKDGELSSSELKPDERDLMKWGSTTVIIDSSAIHSEFPEMTMDLTVWSDSNAQTWVFISDQFHLLGPDNRVVLRPSSVAARA